MPWFLYRILLIIYLIGPSLLLAQPQKGIISGTLSDEKGKSVPGITVLLEGSNQGDVVDFSGKFEIKNITPGSYRLIVSGIGYVRQTHPVTIKPRQQLIIDIELKEDTRQLDEVVVKAASEATQMERSALSVKVVETKEVRLQTADLGEVLARTQGVSVRRSGGLGSGTQFSLNGLSDDKIRFFLDGIPLDYAGYTYGLANVPVNLISRIELYKGVVPILFGADALGGAVNLVSPEIFPGFSGSASYQTGSFGTHRLNTTINYMDKSTGFFIKGGGFYDFARNNYHVDVQWPDEKGRLQDIRVRRFHDDYEARGVNLSAGVKNKSWADELSLQAFATDYRKEIQNNVTMQGNPYGDIVSFNQSQGINLIYKNEFAPNASINLIGGYSYRELEFVDTSRCVYNWYGECIQTNTLGGERRGRGRPSHQFNWDNRYFARINASWQIAKNHILEFSSAPTYDIRTGDETFYLENDPLATRSALFSWVNGLAYQFNALNERLENSLFVKNYVQRLEAEKVTTNNNTLNIQRDEFDYGFGNAFRFYLTRRLMTKFSYEYAIRLPNSTEVFGDGENIAPNLELEPERSHNANFEVTYASRDKSGTDWQIQANIFTRSLNNLIQPMPAITIEMDRIINRNVNTAHSNGVEIAGNWSSANGQLNLSANSTYLAYINNSRRGNFSVYRGDRIPNRPYLFANSTANYSFPEVISRSDKLTCFSTARYVHDFFRSWESAGSNYAEFKDTIPAQLTLSAGTTYQFSTRGLVSALTIEVQNLTNERVFDFFGVQKPGRASYVKLTTSF